MAKGMTQTVIDQYLSYRPLPKYFENVFEISEYLNANNRLSHCQSGFRSLHSTLTAPIDATNGWLVSIDNGLVNGVVFIDLKKAFDTTDDNVFLRKLRIYGVDTISIKWFESYLVHRSQRCGLARQSANAAPVFMWHSAGYQLWTTFIPSLYSFNNLPNCLSLTSPRMFADDTNITFPTSTLIDLEKICG